MAIKKEFIEKKEKAIKEKEKSIKVKVAGIEAERAKLREEERKIKKEKEEIDTLKVMEVIYELNITADIAIGFIRSGVRLLNNPQAVAGKQNDMVNAEESANTLSAVVNHTEKERSKETDDEEEIG